MAKEAIKVERARGKAIMKCAIQAGQVPAGLVFLERGISAKAFERMCASLRGEPGTFGHMAGVGPGRSVADINASFARSSAGQSPADLAAAVIAAGNKAGMGRRFGSRA